MIELEVEEYCQDCPGFEAESDIVMMFANDSVITTCTSVKCVNLFYF